MKNIPKPGPFESSRRPSRNTTIRS